MVRSKKFANIIQNIGRDPFDHARFSFIWSINEKDISTVNIAANRQTWFEVIFIKD
jgi:hypothetical protein